MHHPEAYLVLFSASVEHLFFPEPHQLEHHGRGLQEHETSAHILFFSVALEHHLCLIASIIRIFGEGAGKAEYVTFVDQSSHTRVVSGLMAGDAPGSQSFRFLLLYIWHGNKPVDTAG